MAEEFVDSAYKTGAGRYLQDGDALSQLPAEVARLGGRAFIVAGEKSWAAAGLRISRAFNKAATSFSNTVTEAPCSSDEAHRLAEIAAQEGCEVIVGVGGGRIMDLAKAVAHIAGASVVEVPTSMATCAAYTPLSVMYTSEGAYETTWRYEYEIDAVIVDDKLMSKQPARLVAAGVLDAMAKKPEIANGLGAVGLSESADVAAAYAYADVNFDLYRMYGVPAYDAAQRGENTEELRKVVFANFVLTGVVSSLTRGFHQTALGHKFYDGIRGLWTKECAGFLHGELVAMGLLIQTAYNRTPEESQVLQRMMARMNMPMRLADLGIEPDDPKIAQLRKMTGDVEFVPEDEAHQKRFREAFRAVL